MSDYSHPLYSQDTGAFDSDGVNNLDLPNAVIDLDVDCGLVSLVDILQSIDASNSLASLNKSSMSDNNGGRIKF